MDSRSLLKVVAWYQSSRDNNNVVNNLELPLDKGRAQLLEFHSNESGRV